MQYTIRYYYARTASIKVYAQLDCIWSAMDTVANEILLHGYSTNCNSNAVQNYLSCYTYSTVRSLATRVPW